MPTTRTGDSPAAHGCRRPLPGNPWPLSTMTRCPPPELLRRLLADELSGPEAESVEAHVEVCADCQQALEQLTATVDRRATAATDDGLNFLRRLGQEPPAAAWARADPAAATLAHGDLGG